MVRDGKRGGGGRRDVRREGGREGRGKEGMGRGRKGREGREYGRKRGAMWTRKMHKQARGGKILYLQLQLLL